MSIFFFISLVDNSLTQAKFSDNVTSQLMKRQEGWQTSCQCLVLEILKDAVKPTTHKRTLRKYITTSDMFPVSPVNTEILESSTLYDNLSSSADKKELTERQEILPGAEPSYSIIIINTGLKLCKNTILIDTLQLMKKFFYSVLVPQSGEGFAVFIQVHIQLPSEI